MAHNDVAVTSSSNSRKFVSLMIFPKKSHFRTAKIVAVDENKILSFNIHVAYVGL